MNIFRHPSTDEVTNKLEIPLLPDKDVPYNLNIRTYVGQPDRSVNINILYITFTFTSSPQFHIFETTSVLARYIIHSITISTVVWLIVIAEINSSIATMAKIKHTKI